VLTVFIATRDGAATLPRVLDAYTRLLPPPGAWKLVIVDNASRDDSCRIARSFALRLPLNVRSEPGPGKNRALNTGLRELEGDLAVFSDDDTLPDREWLVALRAAADDHPEYAVFGGPIEPIWDEEPGEWIRWVRMNAAFAVTDAAWEEGPCDTGRVWGANMAVRAELFAKGYRFDERLGPNGSPIYAMGGETEFALRLAIAEGIGCWHCRGARVGHIIRRRMMTRSWVLKRAFHLGRCLRRESRQRRAAGLAHLDRGSATICRQLARETRRLARARRASDSRETFDARWQLNLWLGCLFEALTQAPDFHALSSR
jgi:glycosyltransferase involved in cell wall biosynthesis